MSSAEVTTRLIECAEISALVWTLASAATDSDEPDLGVG
jgi:hypothetical protein